MLVTCLKLPQVSKVEPAIQEVVWMRHEGTVSESTTLILNVTPLSTLFLKNPLPKSLMEALNSHHAFMLLRTQTILSFEVTCTQISYVLYTCMDGY